MHTIQITADAELLQLAATWADAHPDLHNTTHPNTPPTARRPQPGHRTHDPNHDPDHDPLIPTMDWRAGASFAAALGMSTQAARV